MKQQVSENVFTTINEKPLNSVKKKMVHYDTTGARGTILKYCYFCLFSLPPTSVEPERNFSVAENIVTKLRTSLSEDSFKALTMLKCYFIKIKLKDY